MLFHVKFIKTISTHNIRYAHYSYILKIRHTNKRYNKLYWIYTAIKCFKKGRYTYIWFNEHIMHKCQAIEYQLPLIKWICICSLSPHLIKNSEKVHNFNLFYILNYSPMWRICLAFFQIIIKVFAYQENTLPYWYSSDFLLKMFIIIILEVTVRNLCTSTVCIFRKSIF